VTKKTKTKAERGGRGSAAASRRAPSKTRRPSTTRG
jgi:hypothetical protein